MSWNLHVRRDCGESFERVISNIDMQLVEVLAESEKVNSALAVVFGSCEIGEEEEVPRGMLADSCETLLAAFQEDERLPYMYTQADDEDPNDKIGGTSMGGIRIGGELYAIVGGLGKCILEKIELYPSGRGKVVESQDIRGRCRIETDNLGTIRIIRRKRPLNLDKAMKALGEFLRGFEDENVYRRFG